MESNRGATLIVQSVLVEDRRQSYVAKEYIIESLRENNFWFVSEKWMEF